MSPPAEIVLQENTRQRLEFLSNLVAIYAVLDGFQQPRISLVRLRMTALLAPLESTSTWLEATKLMTA